MSIATEVESSVQATEQFDVATLVRSAATGDRQAWGHLVDRYEPLILAMTRRYRLSPEDSNDVTQFVWLKLLEFVGRIREPLALPGWIKTVAKNEALRIVMVSSRCAPVDPTTYQWNDIADASVDLERDILRRERGHAARMSLNDLRPRHREMFLLLNADLSYAEIGRRLRMPVGSIGPTRARCLEQLRTTSAIRRLSNVN